MKKIPYGSPPSEGLDYMAVEISYGSRWVNLNDYENYQIAAEGTRDAVTKSWRRTTAQSPVLGGEYLIHAVPDMVGETVSIWVRGQDQSSLADNYYFLSELFEQFDYRIRWTFDEYREYWRCQLAEETASRGHVWTHNKMALCTYSVPRFPTVTRERIE